MTGVENVQVKAFHAGRGGGERVQQRDAIQQQMVNYGGEVILRR